MQNSKNLKLEFIPSRSSINKYFDRDIDFGYRHQRINLELNLKNFQIDLLKKGDTIYAKTIRLYYNPLEMDKTTIEFASIVDTTESIKYLYERNKFYNSKKSIPDMIEDLSKNEYFASYCGIGSSKTQQWILIEKLVSSKNTTELFSMLQNICIETQSYGVSGFSMLEKKGYKINQTIQQIIEHIKKRNSEIIICSGCIIGDRKRIYTD
jgi:hypothetical protein